MTITNNTITAIREAIENTKTRSAWERGVIGYALEILDQVKERSEYEGQEPETIEELNDYMLNGAKEDKTMEELKKRYFDFVDELDPYRDTEDDQEITLEGMLYNLLAIKEDADAWKDDFPELYETLEATIQQFKAAGIEIF